MIQKEKKLIVLPGNLTSSFFVNEIPYFQQAFDQVIIITFGKLGKREKQIIEKFHLDCRFCSLRQFRPRHILSFINWMRLPYVKKEIKTYTSFSRKGLERLAYLLFYGIYHIITEPMLLQEIEKNDRDIYLYAFWMSRAAYCLTAPVEKYAENVKKICTRAHRYDLYQERNHACYLPFRWYLAEKLDVIYFISEDGRRYFKEQIIGDKPLSQICDMKISHLGTKNKKKLQKKTISKNRVVLASCSSVIDVKRLDLIIELMAYLTKRLSEEGGKVRWIHIGDGEQMKEIKKQCAEKLKTGCYRLLGQMDNAEILKTYIKNNVDYFVNLSDSEGVPVSIMEAMSVGLPVIARDVGGNREIVNERNGLLIPDPLPDGWKNQVWNWMKKNRSNRNNYGSMQVCAYEMWDKQYNADRNYPQFFEDMRR